MITHEICNDGNRLPHNLDCVPFTTTHLSSPTLRKQMRKSRKMKVKGDRGEKSTKIYTQIEAVWSCAIFLSFHPHFKVLGHAGLSLNAQHTQHSIHSCRNTAQVTPIQTSLTPISITLTTSCWNFKKASMLNLKKFIHSWHSDFGMEFAYSLLRNLKIYVKEFTIYVPTIPEVIT